MISWPYLGWRVETYWQDDRPSCRVKSMERRFQRCLLFSNLENLNTQEDNARCVCVKIIYICYIIRSVGYLVQILECGIPEPEKGVGRIMYHPRSFHIQTNLKHRVSRQSDWWECRIIV